MLFIAAASMMAASASAQISLVKEVEKLAGSNDVAVLQGALEKIQPALTNPETAGNAQTWFTAGKAAFQLYDQLQAKKLIGQVVDSELMGTALSSGFNFMQKALPLDSVKETNKDGTLKLDKNGQPKIKVKYSGDIVKSLVNHINDVAVMGNEYLERQQWEKAADSYGNYCNIGSSAFAASNGVSIADSTLAQVRFFEGYSRYQVKDFAKAYEALTLSRKLGYTENQVAEFQTSALANMVQDRIDAKDFTGANSLIDNAIAGDAGNAVLYDMKGFAVEAEKDLEAAIPFYKKSVEVNPNYAQGYFDVARCLWTRGNHEIDNNPEMTTAQLSKILIPIYNEALPYLNKALELNPDNTQAKSVLDDINYKMEQMGAK